MTGHCWTSRRKAGFHWLADAFLSQGWEVLFLTTSLSLLSIPRLDHRLKYISFRDLNQLRELQSRLFSYISFTTVHPAHLRVPFFNRLFTPVFQNYADQVNLRSCKDWVQKSHLCIFESTSGLLLMDRIQQINPDAKYIYRVSDDLRFLRSHPVVLEAEERALEKFDLISTPSAAIFSLFQSKSQGLRLDYHAIRKDLFDASCPNPYQGRGTNAVFSGISHFDLDFLEIASQCLPEWNFHIIGPIRGLPKRSNVFAYGEVPFIETIPYIKHADIGLQTRSYVPGVESLNRSLKTIQYTYCRLPIVAPDYLKSDLGHWYTYKPGDASSIVETLTTALNHPRETISTVDILSWDEIVADWCQELGI